MIEHEWNYFWNCLMAEFGIRGVEFLGSATREVVFIHKTYNKLLDELSYSSAERRSCTAS
jgi:hypothetical protein